MNNKGGFDDLDEGEDLDDMGKFSIPIFNLKKLSIL